ncbi:MAG TPA: NAD(P)-binding protein [Burkholderiaceae bacterium]|nr:NAD(P)-binding protein [Burkholderiaceae bacterium]
MGPGDEVSHRLARRELLQAGAAAALVAACSPPTDPAAPLDLSRVQGGFVGPDPQRGHTLVRDAAQAALATPGRVRRVHTLIAGGGVAGLAAARGLMQQGQHDFALLELEDEAGGNARAGTLQGLACPWGAHYLPVPGPDNPDLQALLAELGLLHRDAAGRWQPDERHLVHSPQERLWFNGQWQSGLLPLQGVGPATLAQYRRFGELVRHAQQTARAQGLPFQVPFVGHWVGHWVGQGLGQWGGRSAPPWAGRGVLNHKPNSPSALLHIELDALFFDEWLTRQGLTDPHLRWYLDYVCRDEYGAGLTQVSAWAGVHYFAARHGFALPGDLAPADRGEAGATVFTWPEGNAFVVRRMAAPLGERLHTGWVVQRVAQTRQGVAVDAQHAASGERVRWLAQQVVLALPAQVLTRVLDGDAWPAAQRLRAQAARVRHAAWVVTNLHLRQPLADRGGAAPSWDNVAYRPDAAATGSGGLGYVDATHQALHRAPQAPTVLTHYRALGTGVEARRQLLAQPWTHWVEQAVAEWRDAHPDLPGLITHASVARHGHGMGVPCPGFLNEIGLQRFFKKREQLSKAERESARLLWAHSDASGMSTFEEAFAQGLAAGRRMGAALSGAFPV